MYFLQFMFKAVETWEHGFALQASWNFVKLAEPQKISKEKTEWKCAI